MTTLLLILAVIVASYVALTLFSNLKRNAAQKALADYYYKKLTATTISTVSVTSTSGYSGASLQVEVHVVVPKTMLVLWYPISGYKY